MKVISGVIASAMVFAAVGSANAACYEFTLSTETFVFNVTETAEGKNTLLAGIGYVPSEISGIAIGGIVDFVASSPPPGPKLLTINWVLEGVEVCLISSAVSATGIPVSTGVAVCGTSEQTITLVKAACSTVPPPNAPAAGNKQKLLSLLHGSAGKAAQ